MNIWIIIAICLAGIAGMIIGNMLVKSINKQFDEEMKELAELRKKLKGARK